MTALLALPTFPDPGRISLIRPCTEQDRQNVVPVDGADEVLFATEPGKAHACNIAARGAKGKVLVFLDADTYIEGSLGWYRNRPDSESFWVSPSWNVGPG